jgi:hypothetical protein
MFKSLELYGQIYYAFHTCRPIWAFIKKSNISVGNHNLHILNQMSIKGEITQCNIYW